jgi:hypothetical protein
MGGDLDGVLGTSGLAAFAWCHGGNSSSSSDSTSPGNGTRRKRFRFKGFIVSLPLRRDGRMQLEHCTSTQIDVGRPIQAKLFNWRLTQAAWPHEVIREVV